LAIERVDRGPVTIHVKNCHRPALGRVYEENVCQVLPLHWGGNRGEVYAVKLSGEGRKPDWLTEKFPDVPIIDERVLLADGTLPSQGRTRKTKFRPLLRRADTAMNELRRVRRQQVEGGLPELPPLNFTR